MKYETANFRTILRRAKKAYTDVSTNAAALFERARRHTKTLYEEYRFSERSREIGQYAGGLAETAESYYGEIRQKVMPDREAKTPRDLLTLVRDELVYIISCVLQISRKSASKWADRFGSALAAKLAAVGVTTSLLGLVAMFGTAGTGAAISGLSGAAATSATMAWVGGIIGGGMVAGTFLTAGVGLVVGYAAYKTVGSKERAYEELTDIDKGVIETCSFLSKAIGEAADGSNAAALSAVEADLLYQNALLPLFNDLVENSDDICSRLDKKNAIAFRQHAIKDYERVVIQGFSRFIEDNHRYIRWKSAARIQAVIGGVFYALMSREAVDRDLESQMVLAALRRSDNDLVEASELKISEYLSSYSADQLKGIAYNVKGIYHELLFVHDYNETHDDTFAELFGSTNNPGTDVLIKDRASGDVLSELQLKATDSVRYVREHQSKYPDMEVRVTTEVSEDLENVASSEISNEALTQQVNANLNDLSNNTIYNQMTESAGLIGLISAGKEAIVVLQGRKSPGESARSVVEAATAGSLATGITAFLFS